MQRRFKLYVVRHRDKESSQQSSAAYYSAAGKQGFKKENTVRPSTFLIETLYNDEMTSLRRVDIFPTLILVWKEVNPVRTEETADYHWIICGLWAINPIISRFSR